jgi:hypothetical protein
MGTKVATQLDWFDKAVELPRADTPSTAARKTIRNRWRLAVMSTLVLAPIALLSSLLAALDTTPPLDIGSEVPGRTVATYTASQWVDHSSALTSDTEVVWSSAKVTQTMPSLAGQPAFTLWTHTFNAHDTSLTYTLEVSVAVSSWGEDVVGLPSLSLLPTGSQATITTSSFWPKTESTPVSEVISAAAASWAKAFTSGDPGALQLAVGDPTISHGYQPLNVRLVSSAVTGASAKLSNPSQVLARIEMRIAGTCAGTDEVGQSINFDLLIDGGNTASPRVVAWGSPGTGGNLTKYSNSIPMTSVAPINIECR